MANLTREKIKVILIHKLKGFLWFSLAVYIVRQAKEKAFIHM